MRIEGDKMKKRLVIEYDIVTNSISIPENEMSTFEAFGMLEAAKLMIADRWMEITEGEELNE